MNDKFTLDELEQRWKIVGSCCEKSQNREPTEREVIFFIDKPKHTCASNLNAPSIEINDETSSLETSFPENVASYWEKQNHLLKGDQGALTVERIKCQLPLPEGMGLEEREAKLRK